MEMPGIIDRNVDNEIDNDKLTARYYSYSGVSELQIGSSN